MIFESNVSGSDPKRRPSPEITAKVWYWILGVEKRNITIYILQVLQLLSCSGLNWTNRNFFDSDVGTLGRNHTFPRFPGDTFEHVIKQDAVCCVCFDILCSLAGISSFIKFSNFLAFFPLLLLVSFEKSFERFLIYCLKSLNLILDTIRSRKMDFGWRKQDREC